MINIVKSPSEANLITHGGVFHADDVFATVILSKLLGTARVCRTFKVPTDAVSNGVIVYDIGWGSYDHHQKGGNGAIENGIPYASVGLIWRDFGGDLLTGFTDEEAWHIWKYVDHFLISGIDAVDNGDLPKREYPVQDMNVSRIISEFNPDWDSNETPDEAFLRAVVFAEIIFNNTLAKAISEAKAGSLVEKAIETSVDGVLVLDEFMPWQHQLFSSSNEKARDIKFIVYPSNRGGYNWQTVPLVPGGREYRKVVPVAWRGASVKFLRECTGAPTASFCHSAGFIGGAETLEDTIAMVKCAMRS